MRIALLFLALAAILFAVGAGRAARLLLAVRILDELRRPGPDSWLGRATPAPSVTALTLAGGGLTLRADLYRPRRRAAPVPLILVPGLVEQGKDDPRVPPFASLLARAGFTVVVPDLPSFHALRVHPDNVRELAAAFDGVVARDDLAPRGTTGLFGISYAGGIALLVALDPARAARVPFVAAVGAYADLDSALRFLATGQVLTDGRTRQVEPDLYGQLVMLRTCEEFLTAPRDQDLLEAMAARRMRDPGARIADLAPGLSPQARVLYDLFETAPPDQVPERIGRLPRGLIERMGALSPSRRSFVALRARLHLVHARDDGTFPVSEAFRLRRLARGRAPVSLVILRALRHVDPEPWRRDPLAFIVRDLPEAARLAWWWYKLLGERGW